MIGEGNGSHSKSIPPKYDHDIGRALVDLLQQMRKLTQEVEQLRGSARQNPYRRGYDVIPINFTYSSSRCGIQGMT